MVELVLILVLCSCTCKVKVALLRLRELLQVVLVVSKHASEDEVSDLISILNRERTVNMDLCEIRWL